MKRRVLIVAAEQFELAPIRRAVRGQDHTQYVFAANGPGSRLVGEAMKSAGTSFDAYVSVGLCGGLVDQLTVGSIVVANGVNGASIPDLGPLPDGRGSVVGPIASIDHIAGTVEEKRRLRDTGAIAVEMEAATVMEQARKAGRAFYCIKAVSDVASEGFVLDFNAARCGDGRFSIMRILGQTLRSPTMAFPELARLKKNADRAANALGDFFAHCSF